MSDWAKFLWLPLVVGVTVGIILLVADRTTTAGPIGPPIASESPTLPATSPPTSATPSDSATEAVTPTAEAEEASMAATSPEAGAETPAEIGPSEYYLAALPTISREKEGRPGRCTGGCTGFRQGSGRIQGTVFPTSFKMSVAADGRRSTAVWNLARSCTTLNMTVGLDDERSPMANVTFTLSKDGSTPEHLVTVGLAEHGLVSESVEGAAQIQIAAYVSGTRAESEVPILLGDARVTCVAGTLGVG